MKKAVCLLLVVLSAGVFSLTAQELSNEHQINFQPFYYLNCFPEFVFSDAKSLKKPNIQTTVSTVNKTAPKLNEDEYPLLNALLFTASVIDSIYAFNHPEYGEERLRNQMNLERKKTHDKFPENQRLK